MQAFSGGKKERVKILVNSCISEVDRIGMKERTAPDLVFYKEKCGNVDSIMH